VRDGLVLVVDGDVRGQLLHRGAGLAGQHAADLGDAAVEAVDLGEDLDPVAGRQHDRLADVVAADQLVQRLDRVVGAHRELLEQRHGGGLVAHAHRQEAHAAHLHRRPALLAEEREHLQLHGQVDLADVDPAGAVSATGAKFKMLLTPAAVSRSQTDWATSAGVAMTPIVAPVAATTSASSVHRAHRLAADPLADARRGGVEEPDEAEPAAAEAGVVGQGGAQVADPHQHAGAGPLDAEDAGDAVAQGGHLVAHPADAAGAEVREVLAQAGRVDAGRRRELAGGDVAAPAVGQTGQHPQVHGQAGDGGLRDPGPG
jgi:hypothetical protein